MDTRTEERFVGSARVVGGDGSIRVIRAWQTYVIFNPLNGPPEETTGAARIELDDGRTLDVVDETTLQAHDNGERFQLID